MLRKFDQDLQAFVAGQFLVKFAVGLFRLCEVGKPTDLLFHRRIIASSENKSLSSCGVERVQDRQQNRFDPQRMTDRMHSARQAGPMPDSRWWKVNRDLA